LRRLGALRGGWGQKLGQIGGDLIEQEGLQ